LNAAAGQFIPEIVMIGIEMQKRRLGRTNLQVSIAGLGCGGPSRLGMRAGKTDDKAAELVRLAIDLGVNFIDTAESYGTERAVGLGIAGRRDGLVISTKISLKNDAKEYRGEAELLDAIDLSLSNLRTDRIDILHLHGVTVDQLDHVRQTALPAVLKARNAGKIRHIAISEAFARDTSHAMLQQLLATDIAKQIDVVMVGFNLLNPSARHTVFPLTQKLNIGTEIMFAVRRALSQPESLDKAIRELTDRGEIDPSLVDTPNPLGFLLDYASSITEAGYRFCAHEPGATVVLFGTGNADHLRENIKSVNAPPLPIEVQAKLRSIFGSVSSVSAS
jgi:aryl-alcohol dehydrogenase-like predicted oxidoreductase